MHPTEIVMYHCFTGVDEGIDIAYSASGTTQSTAVCNTSEAAANNRNRQHSLLKV